MQQYFFASFVYVFKFEALWLVEGQNVNKRADWLKAKSALAAVYMIPIRRDGIQGGMI